MSRFLLVGAAVLFSTGGAAIKSTALSGWQVASFRSGVAAVILYAALPEARRAWNRKVLLAALAYCATMILFVLANKLTTAANAIFLQDTAPVYVLLLGPWLLHERARRRDLLTAGVVAFGLALFFVGRETAVTAPKPFEGNILAAVSAVSWALTVTSLRWLGRHGDAAGLQMASVIAGNVIACLGCLPLAVPVRGAGPRDAAVLAYLGIFQVGLAYVCLTRGLRRVPAFEASIILLVEPVLNPIWAWLIHGERPSHWALAGGAIILSATVVSGWLQTRGRSAPAAAAS